VGLTAPIELSLRDAGLIKFYDDNAPAFKAIAARTYAFTYETVHAASLQLRADDVADSLVSALEIDADLRAYLSKKNLRQKFWYQRFADLILDRLWEDLENEHQQSNAN
jgi:hypothetical protein